FIVFSEVVKSLPTLTTWPKAAAPPMARPIALPSAPATPIAGCSPERRPPANWRTSGRTRMSITPTDKRSPPPHLGVENPELRLRFLFRDPVWLLGFAV